MAQGNIVALTEGEEVQQEAAIYTVPRLGPKIVAGSESPHLSVGKWLDNRTVIHSPRRGKHGWQPSGRADL